MAKLAKARSMQESQGEGGDCRGHGKPVNGRCQCGQPLGQAQCCAARTCAQKQDFHSSHDSGSSSSSNNNNKKKNKNKNRHKNFYSSNESTYKQK